MQERKKRPRWNTNGSGERKHLINITYNVIGLREEKQMEQVSEGERERWKEE